MVLAVSTYASISFKWTVILNRDLMRFVFDKEKLNKKVSQFSSTDETNVYNATKDKRINQPCTLEFEFKNLKKIHYYIQNLIIFCAIVMHFRSSIIGSFDVTCQFFFKLKFC